MGTELKPTWDQLLGSGDWEGLVEPLHPDLQNIILRCGNFSQATLDAFNNDKDSKYVGSSRYGKEGFFDKVVLDSASDYEVKAFLYSASDLGPLSVFVNHPVAGSWDLYSNFIGFIAVTTDDVSKALGRREIYVAWRGTVTGMEWLNDLDIGLASAKELVPTELDPRKVPKIMNGWLNIYHSKNSDSKFVGLSPREQLQKHIDKLINNDYKENLSIIVTGHSLGASLATLSAFDLVENVINKDIRVAAICSASPHVGDQVFVDRVKSYPNLKVFRTFNAHDAVPSVPQTFLLEYKAVGVELIVDNKISPYLKDDVLKAHDLPGVMHVVAGYKGKDKPFELIEGWSYALANKDSDFLKEEYLIPASWWVEKNKGMVRDPQKGWILVQDEPVPET
ncbi:phospholipase A1-IIdelta-like [Henckelia pumila]|uniref:phospholipase A1-IIdelta-like n=1 Tax=Henckelia pumila TaxID=405737 RepID=UPI003C6E5F0F